MTPQLILTLSPEGELIVELPGIMATRRKLEIDERTAGAVLKRILAAQAAGRSPDAIGTDSAPTQAQVTRDWEPVLRRLEEGLSGTQIATKTAEELGL
jgi:hypothetical protein